LALEDKTITACVEKYALNLLNRRKFNLSIKKMDKKFYYFNQLYNF